MSAPPTTPLVPPNANVVYKEGPSEHLPQFGLEGSYSSRSYNRSTSPAMGASYSPAHHIMTAGGTPVIAPHGTPIMAPHGTPVMAPHMPPHMALPGTPIIAPHGTPVMTSHGTPMMMPHPPPPHGTPVMGPTSRPPSPTAMPSRYSSALEVQRAAESSDAATGGSSSGEIINIVEQIVYQPVVVEVEKIVEIPEIQYREVAVPKTVEVPEVVEQVVLKEIPVPQYVEIEVPKYVEKPRIVPIDRVKPVGVESETQITYEVPPIEAEYELIPVPIYVPQFIEVPVPVEQLDQETQAQFEALASEIAIIASSQYPSLSNLEDLFERGLHLSPTVETDPDKMLAHWKQMLTKGYTKTVAQPNSSTN
eukprot:Protomagalhaensia_wolfi_Nauph_80__1488@NODE_18_length_4932_cov_64_724709_g14_i0_p1_GENE_NODE_18_length_4932_cov_64_724709_g14_i0NODE_18_length_4932_cov_64_724709_g14_i0_p1_ORF_typecomplete_len363_score71_87IMCp/PF12314_8/0_39IMCp/PF12314_8/2_1e03_NODE_18_length_4932_cov_64_724709_g14_i0551143